MGFFNVLAKFLDACAEKILSEEAAGRKTLTDEERENIQRYQANRRNCARCGTAIYHNDKSDPYCLKCSKEMGR